MTKLEQYYNKFHEENRLKTRHGLVEFYTTLHFIEECITKANSDNGDRARANCSLEFRTHMDTCSPSEFAEANSDNGDRGISEPLQAFVTATENQFANTICQANCDKRDRGIRIADIGAGTGRYSVELCHRGYDVTAVELVKHNLEILRSKHENIKTWQGDARDLHFLPDETFDVTLLFGPMYHLHGDENKLKALNEAKRITKKGGYILVAYVMNDYSVIQYCFREHHWAEVAAKGGLDKEFHTICTEEDLYDYVRIEDLDRLNQQAELTRKKIIAPDGAADYIRRELNEMSEEEFQAFLKYQQAICERPELLGASSHLVDILRK